MDGEIIARHKQVLKNRLYGLLCEREKEGAWEEFLDSILIDLNEFGKEEEKSYEYYVLISKLTSCRYLAYKYYRKTIFECMNLVDRIEII